MCLILFNYNPNSNRPLVVAANRDEVHARSTAKARFWEDQPEILAGRDLVANGTWLGCNRSGRFAALTNFSGDGDPLKPRSRGDLVRDFLSGKSDAEEYAGSIKSDEYAGFNLLLWDQANLIYTSNKAPTQRLESGDYGLSNAELGASWPKCLEGRDNLNRIISQDFTPQALMDLLTDNHIPPDSALPKRGNPIDMERRLACCFIKDEHYGTRASTALIIEEKKLQFEEQSYLANGVKSTRQRFTLELG